MQEYSQQAFSHLVGDKNKTTQRWNFGFNFGFGIWRNNVGDFTVLTIALGPWTWYVKIRVETKAG